MTSARGLLAVFIFDPVHSCFVLSAVGRLLDGSPVAPVDRAPNAVAGYENRIPSRGQPRSLAAEALCSGSHQLEAGILTLAIVPPLGSVARSRVHDSPYTADNRASVLRSPTPPFMPT